MQVVDLSVDGALVHSPASLGSVGDLVSLGFSLGSETEPVYIVGLARICHGGKAQDDDGVMVGMLFENLVQSDRLMIREFVLAHLD